MEDALPQQVEVRAAVHLPLDEFEAIDVALHLAVAPDQCETRSYCCLICEQARGKPVQLNDPARLHRFNPGVESVSSSLTQHLGELLAEPAGNVEHRVLNS